jgi:hypothetical protein
MSPLLEALLQALDRLLQAPRPKNSELLKEYHALLNEAEAQTGSRADALDRAVRQRYPEWLRAQRKPPTLPPNA